MNIEQLIEATKEQIAEHVESVKERPHIHNIIDAGKKLESLQVTLNAYKYVQNIQNDS